MKIQELAQDNRALKVLKENTTTSGSTEAESSLMSELEALRAESKQLKTRLRAEEQSKKHW